VKQSEKMLVLGLGALFHAARVAGASATDRAVFDYAGLSCEESLHEARDFYATAQRLGLVPDIPADDNPGKQP
jgi:hypothetical protein